MSDLTPEQAERLGRIMSRKLTQDEIQASITSFAEDLYKWLQKREPFEGPEADLSTELIKYMKERPC